MEPTMALALYRITQKLEGNLAEILQQQYIILKLFFFFLYTFQRPQLHIQISMTVKANSVFPTWV